MDEVIAVSEPQVPEGPPSPPKSYPLVAWAFIILIAGVTVVLQSFRAEKRSTDSDDRGGQLTMQMQGRSIVGLANLRPNPGQTQIDSLNTGPVPHRLRAIILAGELAGPEHAEHLLKDLDARIDSNQVKLTESDKRLKDILNHLYADYSKEKYEAPSLDSSDRNYLREELGWFGELALAPAHGTPEERDRVLAPATRTAVITLVGLVLGLLSAAAGLFGMVFLLIFFYAGRVRRGLTGGIRFGGLYAETFAIWMALFLALNVAVGIVAGEKYRFSLLALAMLLSLTALAWPVFRGVSWQQVREDIGFTNGRWPILEPFFGLAGYAMTMPLLIIAVFIMGGFMALRTKLSPISPENNFAPVDQPSHPVVEYLLTGNWFNCLQIVVIASILAPIVEETMFRGVLYRHLREASARLGVTISVILSGMVVSFIFAVIHPQGLLAVPPLMALAFGFALLREWRGTLVPSMVAHGINNGLLTVVLILAMG